jgi:hypothetical protein
MVVKVFAGLLLLTWGAAGQQPQRREADKSYSLRDLAWRAWNAAAARDSSAAAGIVAELRERQAWRGAAFGTEEHAYIQTLLDALIEIPGTAPPDALAPYADTWRAEVLILLCRSALSGEDLLLDIRDRAQPDANWIAASDLLFHASSKRFFERMLREIEVTHEFVFVDGGTGGSFCGFSGGGIEGGPSRPKGFPPADSYSLVTTPSAGDVVFQVSPLAVYYRRGAAPGVGVLAFSYPAKQNLLAQFLGAMNGLSAGQSEQLFHPSNTITWQDAASAMPVITQALDAQERSIQSLFRAAKERGLVDASGMQFPVAITISDRRNDKSEALPGGLQRTIAIP